MIEAEKPNSKINIRMEELGAKHRGDNPYAKNGFFSVNPSINLDEFENFLFNPSPDQIKVMNKAKFESGKRL